MRTIFAQYSTGYCGEEGVELIEYPESTLDRYIDEDVQAAAVDHAFYYGHEDETDWSIEGCWVDYDPELHDMYL